jgi:hypothetical protein
MSLIRLINSWPAYPIGTCGFKIMQEEIFQPKYSAKLYFGLLCVIPFEFFMLWQIISGKDSSLVIIFMAAFFGILVATIPYVFIKRIVFTANAFQIEKFLGPTRTIEYTEVVDIGITTIKTKKGNLAIPRFMLNSIELRNILTGLIEQGKISSFQIENKLISQELISRKAARPAVIISFVLWVVSSIIWPYKDSLFRDLSLLGFFFPIYFVVYLVLKNRADSQ